MVNVTKTAAAAATTTTGLLFTARCTCGKVQVAIDTLATPMRSSSSSSSSSSPLRLVCYCKDCRGYYESLDRLAIDNGNPPSAILDNWGGVDWTAMYPRDISITQGKDLLRTTIIRPTSTVRQVYTNCCHTPMFRFGEMSVLMNSNIIPKKFKDENLPVTFRIIGRDAWKDAKGGRDDSNFDSPSKPKMSWSVPFKWFFTMFPRIQKDLMQPMPFDIPTATDVKKGKVPVMKEFQAGSM